MTLARAGIFALAALVGAAVATPLQADPEPAAPAPTEAPAPGEAPQAAPESVPAQVPQQSGDIAPQTYTKDETLEAAEKFFGGTTQGLAKTVEKAFHDLGEPNAYIEGSEGSGAFFLGLRYGEGTLYYKGGGSMRVYWQGPSVGWDFGGNASKAFTLVYNLHWTRDMFQRFPGVDGSLYLVAGVGLNYQRAGDITLAPIRTGVGLRAGANVGYLTYTRSKSWNPF